MGGKSLGVAMSHAEVDGGTINGATIGQTTPAAVKCTELLASGNIGFYTVTSAIAQRVGAVQATLTLTTAVSGGFGHGTSAAYVAHLALLEEIRATLVALGLMKGEA